MRFVALIALLFAIPVAAQDPAPSPPSSEIVVTANPDREEQVRDFVGALTPARGGSIPRFIDAVCPGATGLGPAQKEAVIARLRTVAAAAGIPVGQAGCVPNMFVIVTADKRRHRAAGQKTAGLVRGHVGARDRKAGAHARPGGGVAARRARERQWRAVAVRRGDGCLRQFDDRGRKPDYHSRTAGLRCRRAKRRP